MLTKENIVCSYIHGSEDSTDVDIVYVLDRIPEFGECKGFCNSLEGNPNLIVVEDGAVTWAYKGSIDETNNGLLRTIPYHEQKYEPIITRELPRDICLKVMRATRGILSHMSRSQYRVMIKSALKGSFEERIKTLAYIDLNTIDFDSLNKNMTGKDIKKLIAFQIGQTLALLEGTELYTKGDVSFSFKELKPYLYREDVSVNLLEKWLVIFCYKINQIGIRDCDDRCVTYNGCKYDLKTEQKVE